MFEFLRNQKGFTLVELLVVIVVIGILAAIAVPMFTDSITQANTAKIGADLRAMDTAINNYTAAHAKKPPNIAALSAYLAAIPTPPTKGQFYFKSAPTDIVAPAYDLDNAGKQAVMKDNGVTYTAKDFNKE